MHAVDETVVTGNSYAYRVAVVDSTGLVGWSNTEIVVYSALSTNYALWFDGVNDFARLVADTRTLDQESITLEFWAFPSSNPSGPTFLLSQDVGYFEVHANDDRSLRTIITPTCAGTSTPDVIQINTWNHIAIAVDGPAQQTKVYVNGEQVRLIACSAYQNLDKDIWLGMRYGGGWNSFHGFLDEIRVWSSARTASQIQADFNQLLSGEEEGLVGYWSLDEGSGDRFFGVGGYGVLPGEGQTPTWVVSTAPPQ